MKKSVLMGLVLGFVARAFGADLYVPSQYATIQAGINAAATGDTVWVADGTYTGTENKDLSWIGKHITVRSINGPNNCIIDCENSGRGFNFNNTGQNSFDIIQGFTIRNGVVNDNGGGIYCYSSSPTITNCIISNNKAINYGHGGGIYCYSSSPTITNCIISNNRTGQFGNTYGGGILCDYSSSTITNCIISNNMSIIGGGISCGGNPSPIITNCTILNNRATMYSTGGGIYCYSSSPFITNCIIVANTTGSGMGGGISSDYSSPTIIYNNVYGNSKNYYGISDQTGINGNISADPKFVGGSDSHLSFSSPCIDAGLNSAVPVWLITDLDGNLRIINGTVDMGIYEFHQPFISISPSSGQVGNIVTVQSQNFATNTQISISFGTHQTITTTQSSNNGTFSSHLHHPYPISWYKSYHYNRL
jgi:hypothetical protein